MLLHQRHGRRFLNRSFADGYAVLAEAGVYGGDLDEALESIRHAKRLHPHHPASYHWIEGHVQFQLGEPALARPLLEESVEMNPGFVPAFATLAAVFVELGEDDRGRSVLHAIHTLDPGFSVNVFLGSTPYASPDRQHRLANALNQLSSD